MVPTTTASVLPYLFMIAPFSSDWNAGILAGKKLEHPQSIGTFIILRFLSPKANRISGYVKRRAGFGNVMYIGDIEMGWVQISSIRRSGV